MHNMDDPNSVEAQVSKILNENGWFHNSGWRRKADARVGVVMPPALSMGEAIDEQVGKERERLYDGT